MAEQTRTFHIKEGGDAIWKNAICLVTSWYFVTDGETIGYVADELSIYKFDDESFAIRNDKDTIYLDKTQAKLVMSRLLEELS